MANVRDVPDDATVGEVIEGLLAELAMPRIDSSGRPLTYHARLEREGRHLHASERVAETVRSGDHVVIQPSIHAGGC
jgi:hypothetical protein